MNQAEQLRMTVYASLMAALTAAGAFIAIPIGPVPIVLQNLFVLLSGLLLGSRWGLAAIGAYLLAGALGLPVFAGGAGGIGRLAGPTGGYLIGYLPTVYVVGLISEKTENRVIFDILAMLCGEVIIYACGVSWLKYQAALTWPKAMTIGMLPFLPGDVLKIAAAIPIAKAIRPIVQKARIGVKLINERN